MKANRQRRNAVSSDRPTRACNDQPSGVDAESAARRGFTVIELVVAIAVGSIVILTIASVLSRVSQTRDIARTRLDAVSRANAALDAMRADLISVIRDEDLYNTRVLLLDGTGFSQYGPVDRDEVLVYNERLRPMKRDDYQGEGEEYETQYRLQPGDGALWMRRDAFPDDNGEGGGMALPVVDGVVGVSIEAYDGESWYPDWDSDVMGLPWALRISVTAVGGETEEERGDAPTVTLRTQIPIDRIVPPPQPEEEAAEEAAADTQAADSAADAGQLSMPEDQNGGPTDGIAPGKPGKPGGPGVPGVGGVGGGMGGGGREGRGDRQNGIGGGGGGPKPVITGPGAGGGGYINTRPGGGSSMQGVRGSRR